MALIANVISCFCAYHGNSRGWGTKRHTDSDLAVVGEIGRFREDDGPGLKRGNPRNGTLRVYLVCLLARYMV
jgi:hypothetical protein